MKKLLLLLALGLLGYGIYAHATSSNMGMVMGTGMSPGGSIPLNALVTPSTYTPAGVPLVTPDGKILLAK